MVGQKVGLLVDRMVGLLVDQMEGLEGVLLETLMENPRGSRVQVRILRFPRLLLQKLFLPFRLFVLPLIQSLQILLQRVASSHLGRQKRPQTYHLLL